MKYDLEVNAKKIKAFREITVKYYNEEGRHHFPWRKTNDPWKILLAEMLLRKTTAVQAESKYSQLSEYSPAELRDVPQEALEDILKPLGIYKERARLLKLVGEAVAKKGEEKLSEWDFLIKLPGVGPYAASMVLATALNQRKPGLDRNMIRVLERVFSISSPKDRPHMDKDLWDTAEELMPEQDFKAYNWGVMDLAAAVCRPKNPLCRECMMISICNYAADLIAGE